MINGTTYSYYFLCPRKMWLSYYGVGQEQYDENVNLGKQIDESTYLRDKHNVRIDNVTIDHISKNVLYEVKKSQSCKEMAINQVKYYLYILSLKGMDDMEGCLLFPTQRKREPVYLEAEDKNIIEENIKKIEIILAQPNPPQTIDGKVCKSCAYYEFCFI